MLMIFFQNIKADYYTYGHKKQALIWSIAIMPGAVLARAIVGAYLMFQHTVSFSHKTISQPVIKVVLFNNDLHKTLLFITC